ncbi:hypothetical protein PFISCL1PPCAC_14997, partial [Pristionchus fissidentatus]
AGVFYILWKAQGADACLPGNMAPSAHGLPVFPDSEKKAAAVPEAKADEADTGDRALSRSSFARGSRTLNDVETTEKTDE